MKITLSTLQKQHESNEKIVALTCYDAIFASLLENSGIDVLLVGDSMGNVLHGKNTTLSVTLNNMIYHTHCVSNGSSKALIMADMPFGTAQISPEQTFKNAAKLIAAGAHMVKIEGGHIMAETISFLTQRGIPVCSHIGFTPQSIYQLGGYKVQGTDETKAEQIRQDAKILENAGASILLMEMVPAAIARTITQSIHIPTIGIGAGIDCSGQVLVLHDILGIYQGKKNKFVKNFMIEATSIQDAINNYVSAVKNKQFPAKEHEF